MAGARATDTIEFHYLGAKYVFTQTRQRHTEHDQFVDAIEELDDILDDLEEPAEDAPATEQRAHIRELNRRLREHRRQCYGVTLPVIVAHAAGAVHPEAPEQPTEPSEIEAWFREWVPDLMVVRIGTEMRRMRVGKLEGFAALETS